MSDKVEGRKSCLDEEEGENLERRVAGSPRALLWRDEGLSTVAKQPTTPRKHTRDVAVGQR